MRLPFVRVRAIAAPLRWADINTDDIAPGPGQSPLGKLPDRRHALTDRSRIGENAFASYRYSTDGHPRPEFILNHPPFDRAEILIAGENFGCGSSRETAVWSLQGIGISCIIAPSYGDIFYGNCFQNALLPIRLPPDAVEELMRQAETHSEPFVEIDLERCTVTAPDDTQWTFEIGDYHRNTLLHGLDEIDATLTRIVAIEAHEHAYLRDRPWLATTS